MSLTREDGGTVLLMELSDGREAKEGSPELFVRVHSVDEGKEHLCLSGALGKKFRVTIEEIEDD
jgi:hypothetical protein